MTVLRINLPSRINNSQNVAFVQYNNSLRTLII